MLSGNIVNDCYKQSFIVQEKTLTSVTFGERLKKLMELEMLNANQLAKKIGISHVALRNYLNGRIPTALILKKLADHYGISTDSLLFGTNDPAEVKKFTNQLRGPLMANVLLTSTSEAISAVRSQLTKKVLETGEITLNLTTIADTPLKLHLKRPPASRLRQIIETFDADPDTERIILGCLQSPDTKTLDSLDYRSCIALEYAAMALVYGKNGPAMLRSALEIKKVSPQWIKIQTPPLLKLE
jgi:transcriptional regulator with XRE-family HTH domain